MTLAELMADYTPNPDFEGFVTNDDMVLAVDTSEGQKAEVSAYAVVQSGIEGLDAQMNPVMMDKQYIRAGQSTTKTGTQRAFSITGDRYIGDTFQDFAFSHRIEYGTGEDVNVNYVYFNIKNGKGEKGRAALIVNSDGSGTSGENSAISIELRKSGAKPDEYTYS